MQHRKLYYAAKSSLALQQAKKRLFWVIIFQNDNKAFRFGRLSCTVAVRISLTIYFVNEGCIAFQEFCYH